MLWSSGTTAATVTGYDIGCSTGCPTCGCCNPNCPRQMTILISHVREPTFGYDLRIEPVPAWLLEQRQTPRRMKRPFPADKPARHQAYRRACY